MIEQTTGKEIFTAKSKILVVDDHETTRQLVDKILTKAGYSDIHQAMGGQSAWDKLIAANEGMYPFGFAIIDWHMPDMNGLELLTKIRRDSHLKDLPVMLLTGESGVEEVKSAIKVGVDAYVLKPFSYNQIILGLHNLFLKRG